MSAVAEQIYSVLIGLQGDTLLLPNLAIAEVTGREGVRPDLDAPDWFAGRLAWQGQDLPVARFERLNGGSVEPPGRRTRVVILNAVTTRLAAGRYGLLCEGYPHLVTLNRAAMRPMPLHATDHRHVVLARARVASQVTAIPDLAYIENELAEVVGS